MNQALIDPSWQELDDFVDAFEMVQQRDGRADLPDFLPHPEHPLYRPVLLELLRLDLEYGWQRGQGRSLSEYQRIFPELFEDLACLAQIAFEEYRLRLQVGQAVTPEEYRSRFGIDTEGWPAPEIARAYSDVSGRPSHTPAQLLAENRNTDDGSSLEHAALAYAAFRLSWPGQTRTEVDSWYQTFDGSKAHAEVFRDMHHSDPQAACRLAQATAVMPEVGSRFLDFLLLDELGRGTFGKVYLAQQGKLSDRLVALKISADLAGESQTLARLQHTHIVPIYSIHRAGPFNAVCMPYLGRTTLADLLADIRGHKTLPQSGTALVSTIQAKGSTVPADARRRALEAHRLTAPQTKTNGDGLASSSTVKGSPAETELADGCSVALDDFKKMSYVEAILKVGEQLAEALHHAHERGIVHRDLKPANILLTEDGGPMLVDFNLAHDQRLAAGPTAALLGGTLPYMAPEHIEAFRGSDKGARKEIDARSDIYALGVILYELLTGWAPFPVHRGPLENILPQMIADRSQAPPRLRHLNKAIPGAVESIVRHCLQPHPARRYQTAAQLQEDLQRQRENLPLKHAPEASLFERGSKWAKRHRRHWQAIAFTGLAADSVVLALLIWNLKKEGEIQAFKAKDRDRAIQDQERELALAAQDALDKFERSYRANLAAILEQPLESVYKDRMSKARQLTERFVSLTSTTAQGEAALSRLPQESQRLVYRDMGDFFLLFAEALLTHDAKKSRRDIHELTGALLQNRNAEACYTRAFDDPGMLPRSLWEQRAELCLLLGMDAELASSRQMASETRRVRAMDWHAGAVADFNRRLYASAVDKFKSAIALEPENVIAWNGLGRCFAELKKPSDAVDCFNVCVSHYPESYWASYNRGRAYYLAGKFDQAEVDFTKAIEADDPYRSQADRVEAYVNRASARRDLRKFAGAVADLEQAIALGTKTPRLYLMLADVKARARDAAGAREAKAAARKIEPVDPQDFLELGLAAIREKNARQALECFDQALAINPFYYAALEDKANVLSEMLGKPEEAVRVLDRAVNLYPDLPLARAGRGVLLARLGKRLEAQRDARECLKADLAPIYRYQLACIYALTAKEHPEDLGQALALLAGALRQKGGIEYVDSDDDLKQIRNDKKFKEIVASAKLLLQTEARK
jgi:serine/threonine protein kinase/Tfp pilus assembly protein PilF